jgi:uncharacterized FlaG/YvyC family protein
MRPDAIFTVDPSLRSPVVASARGVRSGESVPTARNTAGDAPPVPDTAALEAARQAANRALAEKGSELALEFDDELNRVVAKLIDSRTHEVIRQMPSEAVLAIARALAEGGHPGAVVHTRA